MKKRLISTLLGLAMVAGLFAGCGGDSSKESENSKGTIILSADSITEKAIFGEVYALALEDAGYTVKREEGLAVAHDSLLAGDIDMILDYTGTAYTRYMINDPMYDSDEMTRIVREHYAKEYNIAVLETSALNNSYGLMMMRDRAKELGIETFQDLQKNAEKLIFADSGFLTMPTTGRTRLEELFGPFNFKQVLEIDGSLKYDVVESGEADVTYVFTTDPQLLNDKYISLEQEKDVWCEYLLVPFIKQEILDEHPEIEDILNEVSSKIDIQTSIELIHKVDIDFEDYHDVAAEYYEATFK